MTIQDDVAEQVGKSQVARAVPRWSRPTARTRSATGSTTTASSTAGTTRRRSSRRAWTSTGLSVAISSAIDAGATPRTSCRARSDWLKYTIDIELRMNEIAEASKRISALLASPSSIRRWTAAPTVRRRPRVAA